MKTFLVWSGKASQVAAAEFHTWIQDILQTVDPFMSDESIRKGAAWPDAIGKQLSECDFGVVFVTAVNQHAPWLNFESGALAKDVERAHVSPLLLNLNDSDLDGPLKLFQATKANRDDILKLVKSINSACPENEQRPDIQVERIFERFWPDYKAVLEEIQPLLQESEQTSNEPLRTASEVLDEILVLSRSVAQEVGELNRQRTVTFDPNWASGSVGPGYVTTTPLNSYGVLGVTGTVPLAPPYHARYGELIATFPNSSSPDTSGAAKIVSTILGSKFLTAFKDGTDLVVLIQPGKRATKRQMERIQEEMEPLGFRIAIFPEAPPAAISEDREGS
jgi:hypothetical protein